jgi:hypothetical protein
MKNQLSKAFLTVALFCGTSFSQTQAGQPADPEPRAVYTGPVGTAPRIFIPPQGGLENFLSAAIVKKHVPAIVTQVKQEALFTLTGSAQSKEESTGGKIARCLFVYCMGIQGSRMVSVQLINNATQETVWAYNVNKASATAYQSTAESVAKHLKKFLETHPQ